MNKFSELTYTRPCFETLNVALSAIMEDMKKATTAVEQIELLHEFNELYNAFDSMAILGNIRFTINTEDTFYAGEKEWINNTLPLLSLLSEKCYKILVSSPFRPELEKELGPQLFTIADFQIKRIDNRIVEDRKQENKLCSAYSKLMASAKISWEGKVLNLSQLATYKASEDRVTRKIAADLTFKFLEENANSLDNIFAELTQLRHGMAKKLGFDNFVELGYIQMGRSDFTPEMVAGYRQNIQEHIVPLIEKLRERQAKRIGVDKLKHYDEGFKFKKGNPKPKGSTQWIMEKAQKMFKELSPETDAFFNFMTRYELLDLETRKGKQNGGYCTAMPSYNAPFIFSNFNGTSDDIRVLIHEAGHAFQKYQSSHFKVTEYLWPTSESAEMHSMSMELFTLPWMELFFEEETDKFKFAHLASTIEFLPYGVAVDEFQHRIYEEPELTPTERNSLWRTIEKKYKPNLDYDGNAYAEAGGRWQQQMHIYHRPFYYIDYTLAQVCALQFWLKMQVDFEGAWKDYLTLCNAGGSKSFLELVTLAGLKSPFEDGVVEEIAAQVEAYLDTVDDTSF